MKSSSFPWVAAGLAMAATWGIPAFGQSAIQFSAVALAANVNARFYDETGTIRLVGDRYRAMLYVGRRGESPDFMVPTSPAQPFYTSAGQAGTWVSTRVPILFIEPLTVFDAQVRFWDTEGVYPTFESALGAGALTGVSVVLHLTIPLVGDTYLTGLNSSGLIPVTPRLDRASQFDWTDAVNVPSGDQPFSLCLQRNGTVRWILARFAVPGEAIVSAQGSSDQIVAVFQRCSRIPVGCTPVNCGLIGPTAPASTVRFNAETNQSYAIAVSRRLFDSGPLHVSVSMATRLAIARAPGNSVEVSWPTDAPSQVLEYLDGPQWEVETTEPVELDGRWVLRLGTEQSSRLFRLRTVPQ